MFWKKRVYLDVAAGESGNASSPHEEGRRAKQVLESARTSIARLLEVQSDDVIFTSGATESNALAILGIAHARAVSLGVPPHILYLPSAHASIVENAKMLAEFGVTAEPLPIREYRVDITALKKLIRPETALVTMDAVCGETGVIWNTREVVQALRDIGCPSSDEGHPMSKHGQAFLHVDASQAPLTEKLTRAHFGADLLTLDGSKVGVPGIGALIVHRTIPIEPLYRGGGQERGLRPGTESPELAEKFAAALRAAAMLRETFRARADASRAELVASIAAHIPNVLINEGNAQAPNILNLSFPGCDTDYLVTLLDEEGFAVSTKSACETDSEQGSRAVYALTGNSKRARTTLRVSWDSRVSSHELTRFVRTLKEAVAFVCNE